MGKAKRKPRPSMPDWWWGQDGCWFCKSRNNCNQCKAARVDAKEMRKQKQRKEKREVRNMRVKIPKEVKNDAGD